MKSVIFDCDNTFGIDGCDVDDGLALIYLLGCRDVELAGITTTYGNSETNVVLENTRRMLRDLNRTDITVKAGGIHAGDLESEAAYYLAAMARKYQGELSVLATGSLTNLHGAWQQDPEFFRNLKEVVLMGGTTEPLLFQKKEMAELNFSCDPEAACKVLMKGENISVITGNNCLNVLFSKNGYKKWLCQNSNSVVQYIRTETDYWFQYNEKEYGIPGYYNWDVLAAAYLVHPEFFTDRICRLTVSESDLRYGRITATSSNVNTCIINLPEVWDPDIFQQHVYETWRQAGEQ